MPLERCDHVVVIAEPADAVEVIHLWPDGPPTRIEGVGDEVAYPVSAGPAAGTYFLRNISDPTLTIFAPDPGSANGVGIIVAPGGGWTINAWSHEGLDAARWLAGLGCTAFLLKYRVQASDPDQAAFDARMAAVDAGLAAPRRGRATTAGDRRPDLDGRVRAGPRRGTRGRPPGDRHRP